MSARTPGTFAVALLLARLHLRRRWSRWRAWSASRKGKGRAAVPRKGSGGAVLVGVFGLLMLVQGFGLSWVAVERYAKEVEARARGPAAPAEAGSGGADDAEAVRRARDEMRRQMPDARLFGLPDWPAKEREGQLFAALSVLATALFLALFFLHLSTGNRDLVRPGWDLEWLFSFPVPSQGLFLARVGEYTLTDALALILLFPFWTVVFAKAGFGWWGLPLGLFAALCLAVLISSLRVLAETWMRTRLSLSSLKNMQAVASILGILLAFAAYWFALHPPPGLFDVAAALPDAVLLLPWASPLLLPAAGAAAALVPAWAALALVLALALCARWTEDGLVVSSGSPYAGRRGAALPRPARVRGVAGKDLRLLLRDRNFLVQMLVLPLLIVGFQLVANPALRRASGDGAVILAYGIGAYVLMFGAFSVLAVERDALWLLYTFPKKLVDLLRTKTRLWVGVALLYTLVALAIVAPGALEGGTHTAVIAVYALLGVAALGHVAAALGALGTDLAQENVRRAVKPQWIYLYLLLAGGFGASLAGPSLWTPFVLVVLLGALGHALWQRAGDRLPLLLDPVAEPEPRLGLSNGLTAIFVFFVLQELFRLPLLGVLPLAQALLVSYVLAGFLTVVGALFVLRRIPRLLATLGVVRGPALGRAVGLGALLGLAAGALGLAWIHLVEVVEPLRRLRESMPVLLGDVDASGRAALAVLAVVAAPVVEEVLFRGILFQGMRRTLTVRRAVLASALLFAVVHPPLSFPPVFLLGALTALLLERSGTLLAAVAAHAVYNATVVFLA